MRFLIKVSYDGTNYNGFQRQKEKVTVQSVLEKSLTKINNDEEVLLSVTGRTDKGVHAKSQFIHADLNINITSYKLKSALNSKLPDDIYILDVKEVCDNFHVRYNVLDKEYHYIINLGEYDPVNRNSEFQYNRSLNVKAMKKGIKYFKGTKDFRAFVTENKIKENCIRKISKAKIIYKKDKLYFIFKGTGFLKYQVRNMVGTLISIGENKQDPKIIEKLLDNKIKTFDVKTAPARGLYLYNVNFKKK